VNPIQELSKFSNDITIFILIYIDDIIITRSSSAAIASVIYSLNKFFALKGLGSLHCFLGIDATWSNGGFHLSQSKYIKELLQHANMLEAKPQPTPMMSFIHLIQDGSIAFKDHTLYKSIVGVLQYVTITRPEIAYFVNKVCQYMHQPQQHHWKIVKRLLRYLAGSITHGLQLTPSSSYSIKGFSYAD